MQGNLYRTHMISFMSLIMSPVIVRLIKLLIFVILFFVSCVILILHLFQEYTNTDNPFGDAHLLETFVWQKVRLLWEFNLLKGYFHNHHSVYRQLFERQENVLALGMLYHISSFRIKRVKHCENNTESIAMEPINLTTNGP